MCVIVNVLKVFVKRGFKYSCRCNYNFASREDYQRKRVCAQLLGSYVNISSPDTCWITTCLQRKKHWILTVVLIRSNEVSHTMGNEIEKRSCSKHATTRY